jgi:hypothetical protein
MESKSTIFLSIDALLSFKFERVFDAFILEFKESVKLKILTIKSEYSLIMLSYD